MRDSETTPLGDPGDGTTCEWSSTLRKKRATASDGTGIYYEVVGEGERTLLIANGLGGRRYAWEDLINALWRDYRLIAWDYRGLFQSDSPAKHHRLGVVHHAEDAECILDAEGVKRASLCGWSMGVQVALELTANRPELIAGLVLLNGTYGHALTTCFQPFFAIPFLPKRIHGFLEFLQRHPQIADRMSDVARLAELPTALLFTLTAGPMVFRHRKLLRHYFNDVLGPSFVNYLKLFQELDAHSVYHLLPDITAPALVIAGQLDMLIPPSQSRTMVERMPHAEYFPVQRASHFALMERPDVVVPAIKRFLDTKVPW